MRVRKRILHPNTDDSPFAACRPYKLGFIALRAKCKMQNVKCKIKGYRCVRTIQRRGAHCASVKRILPKNGRPMVAPTGLCVAENLGFIDVFAQASCRRGGVPPPVTRADCGANGQSRTPAPTGWDSHRFVTSNPPINQNLKQPRA